MGIYDRDYYQDSRSTFLSSFARSGQVCKYLIVANVVLFLLQLVPPRPGLVTEYLILDTEAIRHGEIWRLLTYAFLHDTNNLLHIVFNMLFLWWFGKDMEDLYGSVEFLCFYLVSAVVGGLAFEIWALSGIHAQYCLGASGAVTAVLVLFAFHYPRRVIMIWFVLPVPIWAFVAFSVAMDTFVFAGGGHSSTAVAVHLGGAAFGFLYYRFHWRLSSFWPDLNSWWRRARRPRLRVYREDDVQAPVAVAAPPSRDVDEQLEAKVDAVLEKVARHGQASLSESERQLLLRASEIYRRKRT